MDQNLHKEEITDIEHTLPQKTVGKTIKITRSISNEERPPKSYKKKKIIFRTYQVVWYILGIVEALLTFRTMLKFLGANPASGFTRAIYQLSDPFALPFTGVIGNTVSGNSVFEWSTLIAMAVYSVVAWGIIELIQLVKPVDSAEVEQVVDES